MRKRFLVLAAFAALLLALSSCGMGAGEVAGVQATPVRTARPVFTSTTTPTATTRPSDTPLPTETPAPTETPLPPSDTPPPTETPAPEVATEAPTEVPTVAPSPATATTAPQPQPTSPPPPTATPKPPQVDFRVAEIVARVDGSLTASGLHNIYFTVLDAGGAPLDGIILEEVNNQPPAQVTTGNKGPGKTEFTMWAADYRFKVVGNTGGQALSSETTHVLSVLYEHAVWEDLIAGGICTDVAACRALGSIHYSYHVTFQRTW